MKKWLPTFAWGSFLLVILLPLIRWGGGIGWDVANISVLSVFPLLGLWAFGLMWSHYAVNILRRRYPGVYDFIHWRKLTGNLVLVFILLHPGLLLIDGWLSGYTVFDYVGPQNKVYVLLALLALTGFLIWETATRLRNSRLVRQNLLVFTLITDAAFIAIFFHGLGLGQHLASGWLRGLWIFMGFTGALSIIDYYIYRRRNPQKDPRGT